MAGRRTLIYEDERIRIVRHGSNGRKDPAGIVINLYRQDLDDWSRGMKLTMDELFDLTEVLDDICDSIEDETYGSR